MNKTQEDLIHQKELQENYYQFINQFSIEGKKNYFYKDSNGLVTIGIGHYTPCIGDTDALIAGDKESSGKILPACQFYLANDISKNILAAGDVVPLLRADYRTVQNSSGGSYAKLCQLRMTEESIKALFVVDSLTAINQALKFFSNLYSYPATIQVAVVDMAFNPGLIKFPRFVQSIKQHDWEAAKIECHRYFGPNTKGLGDNRRNILVRQLFLTENIADISRYFQTATDNGKHYVDDYHPVRSNTLSTLPLGYPKHSKDFFAGFFDFKPVAINANAAVQSRIKLTVPQHAQHFVVSHCMGHEILSEPFCFQVLAYTQQPISEIAQYIAKTATVAVQHSENNLRYVHGVIAKVQSGEANNGWQQYFFEIVPALSFAQWRSACRIFKNMTALQIVQQVLQNLPGKMLLDVSKVTQHLSVLEYCVQYRETDLNFVLRLLEQYGIYFYFLHDEENYTLVLSDHISGYQKNVAATEKSSPQKNNQHHWNYVSHHQHVKKQHRHEICETENISAHLQAGWQTELRDASGSSIAAVITYLRHIIVDNGLFLSTDTAFSYTNFAQAISAQQVFTPLFKTLKPTITGVQTAIVVGDKNCIGQEAHVDRYGRVKVKFPWDKNAKSSCWVRVAQKHAGKGFGWHFHPRIDQEVLVSFTNGDPDKPLIIGSVYNGVNRTPYELPQYATRSGIVTRSSKQGLKNESNELHFEDMKNAENIFWHAQKDLITVIENCETVAIKNGDLIKQIKQGKSVITAEKEIHFKVGNSILQINQQGVFINGAVVKFLQS